MKIANIVLSLIFLLLLSGVAHAQLGITLQKVEIDDVEVIAAPGQNLLDIDRGQEVEVRVRLVSTQNLDEVEVHAFISGYEYSDVEPVFDTTPTFDMDANVSYVKKLKLRLSRLIEEDAYKLRILVTDRFNNEFIRNFDLKIDVPRHQVDFVDVIMNPQGKIQAGRALLVTVRTENFGQKDEEDVRVQVSIPELGVSAVDYINEVENEEQEETEELYLKLPRCAKPGLYQVKVDVLYDRGHRTLSRSLPIEVTPDDLCEQSQQPQTIVSLPASTEGVLPGNAVTFPLTVTNNGLAPRSYTLSIVGTTGWADVKITPAAMFVVNPRTAQTAYVTITPNSDVPAGTKSISLSIMSGTETLQQSTVLVPVQQQQTSSVRNVLEVMLAVLIAVLIMLALVIGFMHWKKQDGRDYKPYY